MGILWEARGKIGLKYNLTAFHHSFLSRYKLYRMKFYGLIIDFNSSSHPWPHIRITKGHVKNCWYPTPDIQISLIWGVAWTLGFLKAPQVILMCSQCWDYIMLKPGKNECLRMLSKPGHIVKHLMLSAPHGKHYYFTQEETESQRDESFPKALQL